VAPEPVAPDTVPEPVVPEPTAPEPTAPEPDILKPDSSNNQEMDSKMGSGPSPIVNQIGGSLAKPTINVNNFKYLYLNEKLTENVAKVFIFVYVTSSLEGRRSKCNEDIEELLTYMAKLEKAKHFKFLNYFSSDNNFKMSLSPDKKLYDILSKMYYKKEETRDFEGSNKELNQETRNNCTRSKENLDNLINNGGSFTRKDALFLEFCDKAFDKFLN